MDLASNIVSHEQFSGNRCGHRPSEPRWYERPSANKKTYSMLHLAQNKLKQFYFDPHSLLFNLHKESRTSYRTIRSELREAIVAIAQVICDHVDVATRQVVWIRRAAPRGDSPQEIKEYIESRTRPRIPMTIQMLADKASISLSRAKEAIKALKRAGYLTTENKATRDDDGNIIPMPSVKTLNLSFFLHLDITLDKYRSCVNEAMRRAKSRNKKELMLEREGKSILLQAKEHLQRAFVRKKGYKKPLLPVFTMQKDDDQAWSAAKKAHYNRYTEFIRRNDPALNEQQIRYFAMKQIQSFKD